MPKTAASRKSRAPKPKTSKIPAWRQHWPTICERVAAGETLRAVCRDLDLKHPTILRAVALDDPEGTAEQYARARISQAHSMADEIIAIADDSSRDTLVDDWGNERLNGEWVARSKLRADTRKWLLARLHPAVYGEKVDVTSGGQPIQPIALLPSELTIRE